MPHTLRNRSRTNLLVTCYQNSTGCRSGPSVPIWILPLIVYQNPYVCVSACCGKGPGYATPMEAFTKGKREEIVYIPCIIPPGQRDKRADYLVTVDVDPKSKTYSQVYYLASMINVTPVFCRFFLNGYFNRKINYRNEFRYRPRNYNIFSLKYELLYRLGLDGISARFLFLHFESVPKCTLSIYKKNCRSVF